MGNFDVHVLYTRSQYPQFEPHVTRRSTAVASSHLQRYTHAPTTTTTTRQQQQSFLICDPRVFVVSPRSPSVRTRFPPVLDLGARLHLLCPRCLHLVCTSTSAVHVYIFLYAYVCRARLFTGIILKYYTQSHGRTRGPSVSSRTTDFQSHGRTRGPSVSSRTTDFR